MGNNASASTGPREPANSIYQSSTIPDSFFANAAPPEQPPPYTNHSSINYADVSDNTKVVIRSSDEEFLSLSRKDVDAHTGALVPPNWVPQRSINLPETSATLTVLFQFIGAHKHPKLLNEKFDFLAEVAKAAEKYKIFSAMNTCSERMRSFGDRYPKLVLLYAAHNDYPHIFDETAPRVVTSEALETIAPLLPDHLRLPWLRYHARWSKALTEITQYSPIPPDAWVSSKCWSHFGEKVFHALGVGVHSLGGDLSWIFVERVNWHIERCKKCEELRDKWRNFAEVEIKGVGAFSETCLTDEPLVKV